MIIKNLLIACSLFIFVACGSSVEGEQAAWTRNTESTQRYAEKYPQYKQDINKDYKVAEAAMTKAKDITDEDKKIDAMGQANKLALSGIVGRIKNVEQGIEDVDELVDRVKEDFTSEEFSQKTNYLLEDADAEIDKAETALSTVFPSTEKAISEFITISNDLDDIRSSIDKHYTEIQSNRTKAEQKEKADAAEEEENNRVVAPIPDINCKKCGGKIKSGKTKCGNCGAPVKK